MPLIALDRLDYPAGAVGEMLRGYMRRLCQRQLCTVFHKGKGEFPHIKQRRLIVIDLLRQTKSEYGGISGKQVAQFPADAAVQIAVVPADGALAVVGFVIKVCQIFLGCKTCTQGNPVLSDAVCGRKGIWQHIDNLHILSKNVTIGPRRFLTVSLTGGIVDKRRWGTAFVFAEDAAEITAVGVSYHKGNVGHRKLFGVQ